MKSHGLTNLEISMINNQSDMFSIDSRAVRAQGTESKAGHIHVAALFSSCKKSRIDYKPISDYVKSVSC